MWKREKGKSGKSVPPPPFRHPNLSENGGLGKMWERENQGKRENVRPPRAQHPAKKNAIHADGCYCTNGPGEKENMGTMGIGTASMQKHSTASPAVSFINESIHVIQGHLGARL